MSLVKMRMFRWIKGNIKKDRIRKKEILLKIWEGLVMYKGECLMHQFGRAIWFELREQKKDDLNNFSRSSKLIC